MLLAELAMVEGDVGGGGGRKKREGKKERGTVILIKNDYVQWKSFSNLNLSSLYQGSNPGEQGKTHSDMWGSGIWFPTHPLLSPTFPSPHRSDWKMPKEGGLWGLLPRQQLPTVSYHLIWHRKSFESLWRTESFMTICLSKSKNEKKYREFKSSMTMSLGRENI